MNAKDIRKIVATSPIADHADEIMKMTRPAVKMNSYLVESGDLPLGSSRLGGAPDLPAGTVWPQFKGRPIEFLVQVNLADAMRVHAIPGFPATGWLLLFHDFDSYYADERWQIMYFDDPAGSLVRMEQPGQSAATLNFCELAFEQELCLPSDFVDRLVPADDDGEVWEYFDQTLWAGENGPHHRLGGFPMLIQSEQADHDGLDFLMQIDSDDELGWMWGDAGRVYCWARRKGLLASAVARLRSGDTSAWNAGDFICDEECY